MKNGARFKNATGKVVSKKGDQLAIIDKNTLEHIPSIPMATLQKILSSLNFHRLFRWETERYVITAYPSLQVRGTPKLLQIEYGSRAVEE